MEFEQIIKRLDWVDEEQRKSKGTLAAIEERLGALNTNIELLNKRMKALEKTIPASTGAAERLDQFEQLMTTQRVDFTRTLEDFAKKSQQRENKADKRRSAEITSINEALAELRISIEKTQEMRRDIKARADEDARLAKLIAELKAKVEESIRAGEDAKRITNLAEESRRQDSKRLVDLQGELTAMRKRLDEQRGKIEVNNDAFRHVEGRMAELSVAEAERKQAQTAFLEQQALSQVERDRAWKEIREKFDAFRLQTETLDAQLQELDNTHRAVKRAQETHEELNQKIERRINEITEMQRLAEDRIRQEWVTFKADDQKRWTGFSLSQDEAQKELHKGLSRIEERMTTLEDTTQALHDQVEQTTDTTERQMEELMNWAHEWLTAYERIMGHSRKPR